MIWAMSKMAEALDRVILTMRVLDDEALDLSGTYELTLFGANRLSRQL